MIDLLADRILDVIDAPPAKIAAASKVTKLERLDFVSEIRTIDNMMVALIELSSLYHPAGRSVRVQSLHLLNDSPSIQDQR